MEHKCCHNDSDQSKKFTFNRKLKITSANFIFILAISFIPLPYLEELNHSLLSYLNKIWWAILLGLLLGGLIDYFVPEQFITKYLGKRGFSSLLYSVFSGFLLSACSHGILALAIQLYKKGANNASVITFLLAAP